MLFKLMYSEAQLHEAAKFIWDNNPSVEQWPSNPKNVIDVLEDIRTFVIRHGKENAKRMEKEIRTGVEQDWARITGTGGYYVSYSLESDPKDIADEIFIDVEVYVDPAVGNPHSGHKTFIGMVDLAA